ncbi:aldo/keto reductase [Chloroflexota bacterium]
MDRIRLGKTEMMVSKLGFGSIPIQRLTEEEAVAVVKRCLDLGVTYLDTANSYTTSEEQIGKAIAGRREGLTLATKSHSRTREGIENDLKLSLKRLGVEYIDIYQFHGVSDVQDMETVLDPNGPMAVLEDAKKTGVIGHIGVTSHSMNIARELVKTDCFDTIMFPLNFITCEAATELLPIAREHDVGFIAMKPMGGGMLDNATLAFKYLLQFPDILPIPGIEKPYEIEEIVGILNEPSKITEVEWQEMERYRRELGTRFCRRCQYCQPCPEGINTSNMMTFPSAFKRVPPQLLFSRRWAETMEKATECTKCGECETRCPYNLPIREMIAEHRILYEEAKSVWQNNKGLR